MISGIFNKDKTQQAGGQNFWLSECNFNWIQIRIFCLSENIHWSATIIKPSGSPSSLQNSSDPSGEWTWNLTGCPVVSGTRKLSSDPLCCCVGPGLGFGDFGAVSTLWAFCCVTHTGREQFYCIRVHRAAGRSCSHQAVLFPWRWGTRVKATSTQRFLSKMFHCSEMKRVFHLTCCTGDWEVR